MLVGATEGPDTHAVAVTIIASNSISTHKAFILFSPFAMSDLPAARLLARMVHLGRVDTDLVNLPECARGPAYMDCIAATTRTTGAVGRVGMQR